MKTNDSIITMIPADKTRFPRLTRAILAHIDRDQLEDICNHDADTGWPGFTYTRDCVAFFRKHRADILALAKDTADALGEGDLLALVAGFRCLAGLELTGWQVAEAINGRGEDADTVQNALAWFALEEVARELCPDA